MDKFKVIVCDDIPDKAEALKHFLGDKAFSYTEVSTYEALIAHLTAGAAADALFLDLRFENPDPKTPPQTLTAEDVRRVRELLGPAARLFIYTSYTADHYDLLRELGFGRVVTDWFDYADFSGNDDEQTQARGQTVALRIYRWMEYSPDAPDAITVLQLSDLHHPRTFTYGSRPISHGLTRLVLDQLSDWQTASPFPGFTWPHLCVVSGDVTETGSFRDFDEAERGLDLLMRGLEAPGIWPAVPLVVAPGNHDMNRRLSLAEEHDIDRSTRGIIDAKECDERLADMKWFPFASRFIHSQRSTVTAADNHNRWTYHDFTTRLGIGVIVYNTAHRQTFRKRNVEIDTADFDAIETLVARYQPEFTILVAHHPVREWDGDDTTHDQMLTMLYRRLRVRVILSGHRHQPRLIPHRVGDKKIIEIQTGSTGAHEEARGAFVPPSYRIISIRRNSERAWGQVSAITFSFNGTTFVPQNIVGNNAVDEESFG